MVEVAGADGGALVEAEYLVEVLDRGLVEQLLRHYAVLLDNALANPDTALSACGLMSEADAEWLRRVSSGRRLRHPGRHAARIGQLSARRAHPMRSPLCTKVASTAIARSMKKPIGWRTG